MFLFKQISFTTAAAAVFALAATAAHAADVEPGLKGHNVQYVLCRGADNGQQYMATGPKEWAVRFRNGATGTYREINRDEWSVYLESDDARVQLDLFKKECTWIKNNTKRVNDIVAAHSL